MSKPKQTIKKIDVSKEVNKLANQKVKLDQKNVKPKKQHDLHIRINSIKLLRKLNIWKDKIKANNLVNENKVSINSLLNELIDQYLDDAIAKDLYQLNKQYINDAINELIFKRNFGLVEYINQMFIELMQQIEAIVIKTNVLTNLLTTKNQQKDFNYINSMEPDFLKEIINNKKMEVANEFALKPKKK